MSASGSLEKKAPPLKFLLSCSDSEVGNFELVKLGEVANLRSEMLELFDSIKAIKRLAEERAKKRCEE